MNKSAVNVCAYAAKGNETKKKRKKKHRPEVRHSYLFKMLDRKSTR